MEVIKQAIKFHKKGDFLNAEKFYLQFLKEKPEEAKAHHLLGALYMQTGEYKKALNSLETAFKFDTSDPIKTDLALCLYEVKEYRKCFFLLEEILENSKSKVLYEKILDCTNRLRLGVPYLKYALKYLELFGEELEVLRNTAGYALDTGRFDLAEKYNKRLIELCPDDNVAYNNLALTYEFELNFPLAEEYYRKTIALKPNLDPIFNLSVLLRRMRRYEESLQTLESSRKYGLKDEGYNFSVAGTKLILRDFSGYKPFVDFVKLQYDFKGEEDWDGKPDKDKTLVIRATEGYGDVFMFARYLDLIDTSLFKEVILMVPTSLFDLLSFNFPNYKVIDWGLDAPEGVKSAILMEVPALLNVDFDHVPSSDRYFITPPEYSIKWKDYFDREKFNIGIFYSGNFNNKRTLRNRGVPFELLTPLFDIKNVQYYSMQPEEHFLEDAVKQNEKTGNIESLSGKLKNFSDTAAVIDNLDLVITIDSAAAHLASALGKKTFMLLPYSGDWRWFEDDNKTIWYDSMTIFRQKEEGKWEEPIGRLKAALVDILKEESKKGN